MFFSAYSGMILMMWQVYGRMAFFHRTCGGDPQLLEYMMHLFTFSP